MAEPSAILTPVIVLVAWTMVMWLWMYATRLPAMRKAGIKPDPEAPRGAQMAELPAVVRWKADNYNHLMEQPTLFYALALALALMGQGEGVNSTLAWIYVVLRILHSLVQSIGNNIVIRFALFMLSSLVLVAMTVKAVLAII